MRVMHVDFFEDFHSHLKPSALNRSDIETIFTVELFVTGCLLIDEKMPISEGWSIMVGYDAPVLPPYANKEVAHRMRVLFRSVASRRVWNNLYVQYQQLPLDYRLFQVNDDNWIRQTPVLFANRNSWFEGILKRQPDFKKRELRFAEAKEFYYNTFNQDQESIQYTGTIPTIPKQMPQFPRYRAKKEFQLRLDSGFVKPRIDFNEASAGSEWAERSSGGIQLQCLTEPDNQTMKYQGTQHIAGGLGTGKSTLMLMETVRLVQEGAKIGFIENSVPHVLNRIRELRELGVTAVPVIGKSNRKKHRNDFLLARHHMVNDVSDWGDDSQLELKHVSDFCIIRALTGDESQTTDYPCKKIKQSSKEPCLCPYASQCGVYQDYSNLIDAQVWVTTSASILRTKLPVMLDPQERTIYEAMYDLLDIIFVDEADEVQKQFDDFFLSEVNLFGDTKHLFEKVLLESLQKTVGHYERFAGDMVIQEWIDMLNRLERTIRKGIYRKLHRSPEFALHLHRKMIRLSTEAYRISRAFSDNDEDQIRIQSVLHTFAENPLEHDLTNEAEGLLEANSEEERRSKLNRIVRKLGGLLQPLGRYKFPIDWLEFYIYLAYADFGIKTFLDMYLLVQTKIGALTDFEGVYSIRRDFTPILKEAMTGVMTGYIYDVKPGTKTGRFKAVQYTGVGRLLLHEWNHIYESIDGNKGPAVVLLSGTSVAPGSAHYNIEAAPGWLLKSNRKHPIIHQEFYPVYVKGSDKPITVSGEEEDNRSRNLRLLTTKLIPKIENELLEWKATGTPRRILLIVNSYDDVADVAGMLATMPSWSKRFRQLSRNPDSLNEAEYSRAELERFSQETADVLIAPLQAISRGYNILDKNKSSLFGSVFFMVRPYPIPHDMTYLIQLLHAGLSGISGRIGKEGHSYQKALTLIRKDSNGKLHRLYSKPDYWTTLKPYERKIIAWYTFVPIWQTIGRLLRNGTNARVFYCDGKFMAQPMRTTDGESMMDYWLKIMVEHEKDPAFQSLYGPFITSIQKALETEEDDE
ncbi:hypothetical protein KP806_18285 [Paenibacillus sp. N4]|uniref:pPIWI_RE_Z domain-containing protein n=1 Tax=Paenibacillus vietnamensis TaxID=2590547 RepID=UPI001CD06EAA|nr:hypothetical protein [Paenibacillus vietnamensis]MCA0757013.1 hypothetical protein [Paenibacillus vietnamensis]